MIATKVFYPMSDGPNERGLSRKHLLHAIDASCAGSAPTTSISTRSTASTPTRRSKKRSRRSTTSSRPARRATSARRACTPGSSRRCSHVADAHGWTRFVSMQNHYNLVYREEEREMLPLCREEGIGVIPWSPLARGFLAGNRRREDKGETVARQDRRLRARAVLRRQRLHRRRARRRARRPGAA